LYEVRVAAGGVDSERHRCFFPCDFFLTGGHTQCVFCECVDEFLDPLVGEKSLRVRLRLRQQARQARQAGQCDHQGPLALPGLVGDRADRV
jgi:hypothetical protein